MRLPRKTKKRSTNGEGVLCEPYRELNLAAMEIPALPDPWRRRKVIIPAEAAASVLARVPDCPLPLDAPLCVGGTGAEATRSVVRFDLSPYTVIDQATLRLYDSFSTSTKSPLELTVGSTVRSWDEEKMTFNSFPASAATPILAPVVYGPDWSEVDVRELLFPGAVISLTISAAPESLARFASRYSPYPPELRLIVD